MALDDLMAGPCLAQFQSMPTSDIARPNSFFTAAMSQPISDANVAFAQALQGSTPKRTSSAHYVTPSSSRKRGYRYPEISSPLYSDTESQASPLAPPMRVSRSAPDPLVDHLGTPFSALGMKRRRTSPPLATPEKKAGNKDGVDVWPPDVEVAFLEGKCSFPPP
jgi:hypothetical protein